MNMPNKLSFIATIMFSSGKEVDIFTSDQPGHFLAEWTAQPDAKEIEDFNEIMKTKIIPRGSNLRHEYQDGFLKPEETNNLQAPAKDVN